MKDTIRRVVGAASSAGEAKQIKIKTDLSQIEIWRYAKCFDELYKEKKSEAKKIDSICTVLELLTGEPAFTFKKSYQMPDVMQAYDVAVKVLSQPLPTDAIESFTFTTLMINEENDRLIEARKVQNFLKRSSMVSDIEIDKHREYKLVKTNDGTFQQFILSEELNKRLFSDHARIQASDINAIANVLAYIYQVDGDNLWEYDEMESKFVFNMQLINKRKAIFRNLDIKTAWSAYNGFFLTAKQSSRGTQSYGSKFLKACQKGLEALRSTSKDGDGMQ